MITNLMVQLFPYMFIALIATMAMFLAKKGKASTTMLYVAVIVQGVIVVAAYAFSTYVSGLSVVAVYINYLTPAILMLNFVLYAVVFNDIVGGLKGKLKVLTAASLVSYSLITWAVFFDRQLFNWIEHTFTFWDSKFVYDLLFGLPMVLWVLGGLVAYWGMLIYVLKTAQERTKKNWAVIAFLCPIVGSVIYLFARLDQVLLRVKRR